jgi:hypothetical protein
LKWYGGDPNAKFRSTTLDTRNFVVGQGQDLALFARRVGVSQQV